MVAQHEVDPRDAPVADNLSCDSRITVTDISESVYGDIAGSYLNPAFDRGYRVAVTETIASLLPATKAFLRENAVSSPEVKETFYRFERWLARRLDAASRPEHWVEHGSGI